MAGLGTRLGKISPIALLKEGWHTIPDIVAGGALAIFSIVGIFGVYQYKKSLGLIDKKRYRFEYTVVRPDDPMAVYAPKKE